MIFGKKAEVKYIPKYMGNDQSEEPASVVIRIVSAEEQLAWVEEVKDKNPTDLDVLKLALVSIEGVYANEDELEPITTAEQLTKCPGMFPLIQEIIREFNRLNFYGGERKNVQ